MKLIIIVVVIIMILGEKKVRDLIILLEQSKMLFLATKCSCRIASLYFYMLQVMTKWKVRCKQGLGVDAILPNLLFLLVNLL